MGTSPTGAWENPKVVDRLRVLNAAGKSASECVKILKAEFGITVTRNGVVGKWHRLKMIYARPSKPAKFDTAPVRAQTKARSKINLPKPTDPGLKPDNRPLRTVQTDTPPRRYFELDPRQCRFGLDDPGAGNMDKMLCCAAPADGDGPWCTDHRALCFHKPVTWQKNAARWDARVATS